MDISIVIKSSHSGHREIVKVTGETKTQWKLENGIKLRKDDLGIVGGSYSYFSATYHHSSVEKIRAISCYNILCGLGEKPPSYSEFSYDEHKRLREIAKVIGNARNELQAIIQNRIDRRI